MVAEPFLLRVERQEKHVLRFEPLQPLLAIAYACDGFAERRRHALEDRRAHHEVDDIAGKPGENVLGQIFADCMEASGKRGGERGMFVAGSHCDGCDLQACSPALHGVVQRTCL